MRKTVKMTFTLDELSTLTNVIANYGAHMKMTACKNGNPTQFDKYIERTNELSSRFYNALIEAEYGKAQ